MLIFLATCAYQSNIRSYSRDSVILAMTYLKYDVLGSYSRMASHGDPKTTTEDVVFVSWGQICFKWQ